MKVKEAGHVGPCEPVEGPRLLLLRCELGQSSQQQNDKWSTSAAMLRKPGRGGGAVKSRETG